MPKVFISYSHDSPDHQARVLALANRLRDDGVDCVIDQYIVVPPEGWPRWMDRQISQADFVLLVCTNTYFRRVIGEEQRGKGLGVRWEGRLIFQHIYNAGATNTKFIPILFELGTPAHIPTPLQSTTFYAVHTEDGYEDLYRRLTNQPRTVQPKLGKLRSLAPCEAKSEGTLGRLHSAADLTPNLVPRPDEIGDLGDCEIDAQMAVTLVAAANKLGRRNAIVDGLVAEVRRREDPTERYWIYTALGEIGGKAALAALSDGIADANDFARQGATDALAALQTQPKGSTLARRTGGWWLAVAGFLTLGISLLLLIEARFPAGQTTLPKQSLSNVPEASMVPKPLGGDVRRNAHVFVIDTTDTGGCEIQHITPDGRKVSIQVPYPVTPVFIRLDRF